MRTVGQTDSYQVLNIDTKSTTAQSPLKNSNLADASSKKEPIPDKSQEQKDQQKATLTDYIGNQSKKTQVKIYMADTPSNRTNSNIDETINSINTLKDAQKKSNTIAAYAIYQENQKGPTAELYGA